MIRLTLAMFARSFRWLAPALLVGVVSAIVLFLPGPPLDNLAVAFLLLATSSVWITVSIGNLDDDAHREMLAARAGGAARLHAARAGASLLAALALGVPTAALHASVTSGGGGRRVSTATVIVAALVTVAGSSLSGVAIGTLLHRPLLRNTAVSVLLGVAALVGLAYAPPVVALLRSYVHGRTDGTPALLAAATLSALASVTVASWAASLRH